MRQILGAVGFTLLIVNLVAAQHAVKRASGTLEGAWKFTIEDATGSPIDSQLLILTGKGNDIYSVDPASGERNRVFMKGGSLQLIVNPTSMPGSTKHQVAATLPTVHSGTEWMGSVVLDSKTLRVRAVPLAKVWACSHSNPSHTADSLERMKELTQEHKCSGWHEVSP